MRRRRGCSQIFLGRFDDVRYPLEYPSTRWNLLVTVSKARVFQIMIRHIYI